MNLFYILLGIMMLCLPVGHIFSEGDSLQDFMIGYCTAIGCTIIAVIVGVIILGVIGLILNGLGF